MKLTEKQAKFVDYYCQTGNAEESARRAGYSPKTARGHSHKLLQNVAIQNGIKKRNQELEDARIADMKEIKQFWTSMLRDKGNEPKDRLKASEHLAKTNGAFLERVEHSGSMDINNPFEGLSVEELKKLADVDD